MENITYRHLVDRYGHPMAYGLLLMIERSARTSKDVQHASEDERLQRAFASLEMQPHSAYASEE